MTNKTYSIFDSQNIDAQIKTAEALIQQQKEELKRLKALKRYNNLPGIAGILEVYITDYLVKITAKAIDSNSVEFTSKNIKYKCPHEHQITCWNRKVDFNLVRNPPKDWSFSDYPEVLVQGPPKSYVNMICFLNDVGLKQWENKIFSLINAESSTIEQCIQAFVQTYEVPEVIKTFLSLDQQKDTQKYNFNQDIKDRVLYSLHICCKILEGLYNPDSKLGKICAECMDGDAVEGSFDTDEFAKKLRKLKAEEQAVEKEAKKVQTTKKATKAKEAAKKEDENDIQPESTPKFSQKEVDEIVGSWQQQPRKNEIAPLITEEQQEQLESLFEQDIKDYDKEQLDMIEDSPEKEELAKELRESEDDRAINLLKVLGSAKSSAEEKYTSQRFDSYEEAVSYYKFIDQTENYIFGDNDARIVHYIKEDKWGIYFDDQEFDPETMEIEQRSK